MTSEDLARIESSLEIRLPDAYRRVLQSFPLPAYAGNSDTDVWDDAERLIELNRELRSGGSFVKPWPTHFYALGREAGGCSQALDLRTGDLWWADRGHLDGAGSYKHTESFDAWAREYFGGLRSDLEGEGGDAAAPPEARAELEEKNARANVRLSGWLVAAVLLLIVAAVTWKLTRA